MGRVLAIDYGTKRVGLAATDPLKIIASPLETIANNELFPWLKNYLLKEEVETIVVGLPKKEDDSDTDITNEVLVLVEKLKKSFPSVTVDTEDERYTSKLAFQTMIDAGIGKKKRRDKKLIDKISASLILQTYLGH